MSGPEMSIVIPVADPRSGKLREVIVEHRERAD